MLKSISKFFIYAALVAPLLIASSLFFPFITGKALFFRVVIELALLFYIAHLLFLTPESRSMELKKIKKTLAHPVFIATAIFTLIFVLSSLTGIRPSFSFWSNFERAEGGFQVIHYFTFFALTSLLFSSKKEWLGIFKCAAVIATAVGLYAVAQFLQYKGIIAESWVLAPEARPSGTLGNSDYFGPFMLFAAFAELFILGKIVGGTKKILWGLLFIFSLFSIGLANGRTTMFAVGVCIALLLLYFSISLRNERPRTSRVAIFFLSIIVIFSIGFIITSSSPFWEKVPVLNRLRPGQILVSGSLNTRLWTWGSAISAVKERPILGWGAEAFPVAFDKYYDARHHGVDSTWYDRAHNIFLDYAISGGLLLLFSYIAIFITVFRTAIRSDDRWPKIAAIWFTAYIVQGMTIFDVLPVYIQFFLLLAFFVSQSSRDKEEKRHGKMRYQFSSVAIASSIIGVIAFTLLYIFTIQKPLEKNRLLLAALSNAPRNFSYFDTALAYPSPVGQNETAESFIRTLNDALASAASIQKDQALGISQRVDEVFSENQHSFVSSRPLLFAGLLNVRLGQLTRDIRYIEKAKGYCANGLQLAPNRIELLSCLYQIAEIQRDAEAQQKFLSRIASLRPDLIRTPEPVIK